jgi:hypothetical protein
VRSMSSGTFGQPKEKVCSVVVKKRKSSARARLSPRHMRFPGGTNNSVSLA